jgi:GGDEF domain-containing protein
MPETSEAQANLVARRVCESLANDGREPKLSVSIGVAIYPKDGEKVETLMSSADAALYLVKGTRGTIRGTSASGKRTTAELTRSAVAGSRKGSANR